MSEVSFRGLLALAMLVSCGGSTPAVEMPVRNPTRGESLFFAVPSGPDLVLEIDVERLRDNPVTGKLLQVLTTPEGWTGGYDVLRQAQVALVAVYDIGDNSRQLVLLDSPQPPPGSRRVGELRGKNVHGFGDADLLARSEAAALGAEPGVTADDVLLRLRASAMPEAAEGGAIRVAARLDFDARVTVASQVSLSQVPTAFSAWADVVDDLAVVLDLQVERTEEVAKLERGVRGLLERLARLPLCRQVGLAPPLRSARIERTKTGLRVVLLLSPKRLQLVISRILKQLESTSS